MLYLTGTLILMSSAYFTRRLFIGETAVISFTIRENRTSPNLVP